MTAPTRLDNIDKEFIRGQKSRGAAISASLTLATTPGDFVTYTGGVVTANAGAWLDIGNAAWLHVLVAFTHGSTPDNMTILPVFANPADVTVDPTVGAPLPYVPTVTGTGVQTAYPNVLVFSKTDWTTTTSPLSSSTVKYASGLVVTYGQRLAKFMGFVNSITNAPTAVIHVTGGTS